MRVIASKPPGSIARRQRTHTKKGSGRSRIAVCDTRLRVEGLANVRVADASAIPFTPVSALNAPSMLVGWRAAAYIRAEHQGRTSKAF